MDPLSQTTSSFIVHPSTDASNIPSPISPIPSNYSVSLTRPITDEALEKAKSGLKPINSVYASNHSPREDPISGMSLLSLVNVSGIRTCPIY